MLFGFRCDAACLSDSGRRKNNEDNFLFFGDCLPALHASMSEPMQKKSRLRKAELLAVFDGVGGGAFGEEASSAAAECLRSRSIGPLTDENYRGELSGLCESLNLAVVGKARELTAHDMGSTVVGLALTARRAYFFNLGDSRSYRMRDGKLVQFSTDHVSLKGPNGKAPITQFLGIPPDELLLLPAVSCAELHRKDQYLLCSDGLSDAVPEEELAQILTDAKSPAEAAKALVQAALANGGRDNITVLVCRIE